MAEKDRLLKQNVEMQNAEGKVIVITGASSGIGEKTAEVLADAVAKVVLSVRREDGLHRNWPGKSPRTEQHI